MKSMSSRAISSSLVKPGIHWRSGRGWSTKYLDTARQLVVTSPGSQWFSKVRYNSSSSSVQEARSSWLLLPIHTSTCTYTYVPLTSTAWLVASVNRTGRRYLGSRMQTRASYGHLGQFWQWSINLLAAATQLELPGYNAVHRPHRNTPDKKTNSLARSFAEQLCNGGAGFKTVSASQLSFCCSSTRRIVQNSRCGWGH